MLIWKNKNITDENNQLLLEEKYEKNDSEKFIKDIEKYLKDKRYIKINGKPIIGLYKPENIPNLNNTILSWREKAREFGIKDLFIIGALNYNNSQELINIKSIDAVFEIPPNNLNYIEYAIDFKNNFTFYSGLIYKNSYNYYNLFRNFNIYRGSILEWDNSPINKEGKIFGEYSPYLFYLLNKKIIKWTKNNYNNSNYYIFINAWNNYFEGII